MTDTLGECNCIHFKDKIQLKWAINDRITKMKDIKRNIQVENLNDEDKERTEAMSEHIDELIDLQEKTLVKLNNTNSC